MARMKEVLFVLENMSEEQMENFMLNMGEDQLEYLFQALEHTEALPKWISVHTKMTRLS
jgi:hypothetical protein